MEMLAISDDVVGATFMSAGRSIPWFFVKSVLILSGYYDLFVDIELVTDHAAFRMLFVTGTCALFSGKVLPLTCWPLFRDLSFYMLSFILLMLFFLDNVVKWWENVILVSFFILYIIFLKYNAQAEQMLKSHLQKTKRVMKVLFVRKSEKMSRLEVKQFSSMADIIISIMLDTAKLGRMCF
ncbi:hypothetical protein ILYODFUR_000384 [Ilyodon furcidens]|uniref:Sodium/potassium/calcium exchanger 1 n=1 Tax=Ilyodon furcidens TaxID=33524 RepID=A0ABV0TSD8_9TELE